MAKFIATIKAIITRLVFAAHGLIAIWQVTIFKKNYFYWYLSSPIILLFFEGIFTLTIKQNQEWKWFCPSVFLYLTSIVPAIWLLELDKVERRMRVREETFNFTSPAGSDLKEINNLMGVQIKLPDISLSTETWITLIEQFLMLILIIGRWMLPKGDLTRDQLSQLLLVYIGTAADIIEFFDSFKDDKIASEPILVLLTLAIWSWSLMQFTVVLTATKSRKSRLTTTGSIINQSKSCCTIDVWGIALNITLQDAPFLVFRLLLITHFKIISYMNVFFTCKNTLVILLQIYRLYVVYSEHRKKQTKHTKQTKSDVELANISIISKPDMYGKKKLQKYKGKKEKCRQSRKIQEETSEDLSDDSSSHSEKFEKRKSKNSRKDTGYSTGSSHTSHKIRRGRVEKSCSKKPSQDKSRSRESSKERFSATGKSKKLKRTDRETRGRRKMEEAFSEESLSDITASDVEEMKKEKNKKSRGKEVSKIREKKYEEDPTATATTTDASTE